MKKVGLLFFFSFIIIQGVFSQRQTDVLDRGLVAVPANSGAGNLISWRIFGEEYYDVAYNLYCDGIKLNAAPLLVSNYQHAAGTATSRYQVAAVVRGIEQEKSPAVTRWNYGYLQFAVKPLYSRRGTDITKDYVINDIALADVNGDGIAEFLVKRNYSPDGSSVANDSAYNCIECYTVRGDRLWYIDLGPNMVSGPDEQYDAVGYDWDGDGRAEVILRGADNMIIHYADGSVQNIGNMNVNTRNTVLQTANMTYTNTGAEYLLYLEGATGKPYPIGSGGALWMAYPLPRGDVNDWGDGYGHRATKHYFGAPFLDGRHPFIFLARGCYTKHHMKAFSVDPATHKLTQYWEWSSGSSGVYYGQGYHNFGIADVDWDGRDEIVFGSMVIDDNGKGLSSTGLGHGDAQHCSDFDPYRHGQEIFACNEDQPAMNYRDATTSKIYYRLQSTSDDGRAICGNFSNDYPGCIGHSSQSAVVSTITDKVLPNAPSGFAMNWRIYWDGDLCEEALDGASSREGASRVFKADGTTVFTATGTANCNWTKNTPSAVGDIFGDWREEIVARTSDNNYIRIYTTNIYTPWRNYTLWHDHQYRQGMVWESVGYNQPPHTSYFLGELEGITVTPPPLTMTGRTEIPDNGSITTANNSQHVIVCETNDTRINVAEGARPYIATFNVPSWVQGKNSTSTTNPSIDYEYYTCTVVGAPFAGDMRIVKQGDGTLVLPKGKHTHTGPTDVWAGTLSFDGTLTNSALWLNRFAELNSDGGTFKTIKADYDAKIRPGGQANKGTITADSLLLGFGSRIVFDIYNDGFAADQVNAGVLTVEKKDWQNGPKYSAPVFEFVLHKDASADIAQGRYLLGTIGKTEGNLADIRIEGLPRTHKAQLLLDDGKLYLEVSGMRDSGTFIWNGNESSTWNLGEAQNFTSADDPTADSETFVSGDKVYFTDDAKQFLVNIEGEIEADSIIVDNSKAYTFTGDGSIVGTTTLVKRGTGTLTVSTDNSYQGGTRISGGTVVVNSLASATQPQGNLGAVVATGGLFVLENGGRLRTTAALTQGSPMSVRGTDGGIVENTADFIVDKPVSGTKLVKRGSGWMKFNVANPSLDTLVVDGGTLQCVACNAPAKTVSFSAGTLRENTSTSYAIHVPKGCSGTQYLVNDATYTNRLTGQGTLTISCPVRSGGSGSNVWYATRTHVSGNWSAFEGTVKPVSNGDPSGRFTLDNAYGMPKATLDIAAGVEVQNSGRTFTIGRLAGAGSLGGSCTFSNNASVGANTWRVGSDDDFSWDGKVVADANFVKIGTGRMAVKGAWTTTGTVTVSEGELSFSSSSSLGKGQLVVANAASLIGITSSTGTLQNSSYTVNGQLQAGVSQSSTSGVINFNDKNVTFSKQSRYVVGASRCATRMNNGCTSIKGIDRLSMNGTISVFLAANHTLSAGDSIRIFEAKTFTGTPQFDLPEIGNGLEWDTSRIQEGLLFVAATSGIAITHHHSAIPQHLYNAAGQRVRNSETATERLPSGLYIARSRKYLVK